MSYGGGSGGSSRISTSADTALSNPADGQALVYNAGIQKWVNGTVSGSGAAAMTATSVKTASYTANANELVPADVSGGAFAVTLPSAPANGSRVSIKKIDTSGVAVSVSTSGSDVFNKAGGSTTIALALYNQSITLQYTTTGGIWYVVSDDAPLSSVVTGQTNTVTANYTVLATDHVILADPSGGAFTVTLPTAVNYFGRYTVTYTGASNNIVTVATTSSQTIDGASTATIGNQASNATFRSLDVVSDGANWRVV
jgi:hypothetical protein